MTKHFYIHIPFCRQKCTYCKFALTPIFNESKKRRYISHLKNEIRGFFSVPISVCEFGESVSEDLCKKSQTVGAIASLCDLENQTVSRFQNEVEEIKTFGTFSHKSTENSIGKIKQKQTIYFGGGTPSVLSIEEVKEILECFPEDSDFSEITLECNPEDITEEYILGIIKLGINRLSLGVQTLNDISLGEIHRSDRESILKALYSIEKTRDKHDISVNIDFILGLPYVSKGEILKNIQELHIKFPSISHTSVYILEDEKYPKHWKENSITHDELKVEFLDIIEYFDSLGWNHYEFSNFSRSGKESLHNQAYWNHSNYRGFGLSASSFEDGRRWTNNSSFTGYYQGKIEEEILTDEQKRLERVMFGIRTNGADVSDIQGKNLDDLLGGGCIEIVSSKVRVTKTGIFLLDHIMSELI